MLILGANGRKLKRVFNEQRVICVIYHLVNEKMIIIIETVLLLFDSNVFIRRSAFP